jgi:hypothetical protein
MESKWPFILITFGLLFLLGLTIAKLEKTTVMNNWSERRCDIPVMAAAAFFKPDTDPRTSSQFATDNFEFCLKSTVDKFMSLFMGPINAIFEKQVGVAGDAVNVVNTVRSMAQTMYNAFLSYLDEMFKKFNMSVFEMSRVVQQLRMAIDRMSAIAVSTIYAGISMFRAMLNSIQVVIRVVLIVCGIMLAIIIILWFILFPFIPIIMATLFTIVTAVMVFSGVLSDSLSADASSKMGGFCFDQDAPILVQVNGKEEVKPASKIQLGDELARGAGRVTTVMIMNGNEIPLYHLKGIYVSGSHLVQGVDGQWKSVEEDGRFVKTERISPLIYCFNTTSNTIPIQTDDDDVVMFRDWEEIGNDDENAQYMWNYIIGNILHYHTEYTGWKSTLKPYCEDALLGKSIRVKTSNGFVPISELAKPFGKVLDRYGNEQDILGIVYGEVENASNSMEEKEDIWHTELYVADMDNWVKSKNTVPRGTSVLEGMTLITQSGEFTIWDEIEQKEVVIRDFTEVGYDVIHETYPFVEARLRMANRIITRIQ